LTEIAPVQATPVPRDLPAHVPPLAIDRAQKAAQRARKNAQVRVGFISRTDKERPAPALARMLRGGRGGQVRLKLYLSYLWMQTDESGVSLAYPAQVWAQLLGLERPDEAGSRRIHEAQTWLERNRFISVQSQPGHANRVTVLNETGTGEKYTAPGAAVSRGGGDKSKHLYVQIPAAFWTSGYLALLTGAGLALYLILLDQYGPGQLAADPEPVWFSPKLFAERYGLSDDTRAKGIGDLRDLGLLNIRRQAINPGDFDLERIRNVYTLQPSTLSEPAVRRIPPEYDWPQLWKIANSERQ
jgi:hypothetical protein